MTMSEFRKVRALLAMMLACGALILASAPGRAQDDAAVLKKGHDLLDLNCGRCHAIETKGESRHQLAPPFRTLGQRYTIDSLEEALGEGIVSGHPDMPEFEFEPEEVGAIIAYLKSIQVPAAQ